MPTQICFEQGMKYLYFYVNQSSLKKSIGFFFQMNKTDSCMPWYFPVNDTSHIRLCDPWEARMFRHAMNSMPFDECDSCLPDCTTTVYTASVTAAPFRRYV